MYETKEEVQIAVDGLFKATTVFSRGEVVPWELIERFSGPRTDNRGKYIINKWRKRLENERDIVTLSSITVGIRFLTHQEVAAEIPRLRQKKAYRQIRRAIKQTSHVDVTKLSMAERKMLAAQQANMITQRRELMRSQKQLTDRVPIPVGNPLRVAMQ